MVAGGPGARAHRRAAASQQVSETIRKRERETHRVRETIQQRNKGEVGKYATTQRNKGPHSRSTTLGGSAQNDAIRSPEGFRLMLVLIGSGAGLVSSCDHRHCTLHAGINNHTRVSLSLLVKSNQIWATTILDRATSECAASTRRPSHTHEKKTHSRTQKRHAADELRSERKGLTGSPPCGRRDRVATPIGKTHCVNLFIIALRVRPSRVGIARRAAPMSAAAGLISHPAPPLLPPHRISSILVVG